MNHERTPISALLTLVLAGSLFVQMFASLAGAEDIGIPDTIAVECPAWTSTLQYDTICIPVYIFNDEVLEHVQIVLRVESPEVRFVDAEFNYDILFKGFIAGFHWYMPDGTNSIVLTASGYHELGENTPAVDISEGLQRQLIANLKFINLVPSCFTLRVDTTSISIVETNQLRPMSNSGFVPQMKTCSELGIEVNCSTDIESRKFELPTSLSLLQFHPNPFNSGTTIELDVPSSEHLTIVIYDILGRHVRTIVDDFIQRGPHQFPWDGKSESGQSAASGVYFARITIGSDHAVRKLVLLR